MKVSSTLVALLFLLASSIALRAQTENPDAVLGFWEAKELTIQIIKSGETYSAKTISGSSITEADGKTIRKDIHNSDPALRNRPLKDYVYITGLKYRKGEWVDGKVYDFTSGKYYDVDLSMKEGKMQMHAYMGVRFFGKSFIWNRPQ